MMRTYTGGKISHIGFDRLRLEILKIMEDNDMNVNWFKNPDNVVYADVNQFCDNFGVETGIENLREKLDNYRANPVKEGINLKGKKRTSLKVFIPNNYFDEPIDMGDSIWIYMGENYECYCIYWPQ